MVQQLGEGTKGKALLGPPHYQQKKPPLKNGWRGERLLFQGVPWELRKPAGSPPRLTCTPRHTRGAVVFLIQHGVCMLKYQGQDFQLINPKHELWQSSEVRLQGGRRAHKVFRWWRFVSLLSHLGKRWVVLFFNVYNSSTWADNCYKTIIQLKGILVCKPLKFHPCVVYYIIRTSWLNYFPAELPRLCFPPHITSNIAYQEAIFVLCYFTIWYLRTPLC